MPEAAKTRQRCSQSHRKGSGVMLSGKAATGKDPKGRFASGNRHSRGASRASVNGTRFRWALLRMVTVEDMAQITAAMLGMAKAGDVAAVRLLLDYTIGKPVKGSAIRNNDAEHDLPPIVILRNA